MKLTLFTIVFSSTLLGPVISGLLDTKGEHAHLRGLEGDAVCKGNRLLSGSRLYRNEYLCDSSDSYRFGLDSNGVLADRYSPTLTNLEGEIIWSPTSQRGAYLNMQHDGNLVLYDEDAKVLWATKCFGEGAILMRSGSTWPNIYTVRPDRIPQPDTAFASDEDKIWCVNSDFESTTCSPPVYCKGDTLVAGKRLTRDEYICPYGLDGKTMLTDSYRFGMNNLNKLVLAGQDETLWSTDKLGYRLEMQFDGNAVVYDSDKVAVWASKCRKNGNFLKLEDQGVFMRDLDGDARWFVGFDGVESEHCDDVFAPTTEHLCGSVGLSSGICRIRMIDHLNVNYVELEAKDLGDSKFEVSDNILGDCGRDPWVVKAELVGEDIEISAGVPDVTCSEMLANYQVPLNDTQLDFLSVEGYPCTQFGQNLIWFMINEWFYFG